MKVSYHVFKDYRVEGAGSSDEEIVAAKGRDAAKVRKLRYSFVCAAYHAGRRRLYLGATNRAGDILVEFDVDRKKFRSLGFAKSGLLGPKDAKIHKGLHLDEKADALYFGTACLSPLPELIGRPGGLLARYDLGTGKYTDLGRPLEGEFLQGTCWDVKRGLAYLFTDRCNFAVYDLRKRKLVCRETMESIQHNSCLDDRGGVWGTYAPGRHGFFRYDGGSRRFEFPGCAIPNAAAGANVMYPGAGPVDGMLDGGDGFLYVGTALGELYRLDPAKGALEYLGKPFPGKRLPGLALGPEGCIYVCGGYRPHSYLARYHRDEGRFEPLGVIRHEDGNWLEYVHEIVVVGNTVYAMETDNLTRSGYLWACEV